MPESRLSTTERVQQALTWWLTEEYLGRIRPWPSDGAAAMCLVCEVARLVEALAEQEQAITEIRRNRIGDAEIIGRWQCQAEAAEAQLAEKDQEGDRFRTALEGLAADWRATADRMPADGHERYTREIWYECADDLRAVFAPPPVAQEPA